MNFKITSASIKENSLIPDQFTCDGEDISPDLKWENIPQKTKSFVLIMDDPDATMGTWDHWLLFNIPREVNQLSSDLRKLPYGTKIGKNSWGERKYGGPCPPDKEHRYFFKLYALDTTLSLPEGSDKQKVERAMEGHIINKTELIGLYKR